MRTVQPQDAQPICGQGSCQAACRVRGVVQGVLYWRGALGWGGLRGSGCGGCPEQEGEEWGWGVLHWREPLDGAVCGD